MHLLTVVQIGLVILGLVFQVVAMTWLYHDSESERNDGEHDTWGSHKIDLGHTRRPNQVVRRDRVHDYYDIEKTPPGIRPADLRKTARVTYMDNANINVAPPPE